MTIAADLSLASWWRRPLPALGRPMTLHVTASGVRGGNAAIGAIYRRGSPSRRGQR